MKPESIIPPNFFGSVEKLRDEFYRVSVASQHADEYIRGWLDLRLEVGVRSDWFMFPEVGLHSQQTALREI